MNLIVTDEAKRALKMDDHDKMIQLSFDQGSCDIVNTIYEIKVIPKRGTVRKMRIYNVKEFSILKSPTSPLINREIGLFHYSISIFKLYSKTML
ncbi:hypothetical protein [Bacillus sp. V2I10]|uniref:hypothetical protein n=1 Tax=Bacillus sp. V2I10 TaxID=3042276 RepID=UPI002781C68C|nr:hypothetical protein [Bacillus sp. V2I10]MDQ0859505.1 hypothetical protein [Bacillus sp. V2I10]